MRDLRFLGFLYLPTMIVATILLSHSASCNQVGQAATAGVVTAFDCETGSLDPASLTDARAFAEAKVRSWLTGASTDVATLKTKILADLSPVKSNLGRCAIAGALAAITAFSVPSSGALLTPPAPPGPDPIVVRATFSAVAHQLGWVPVKVGGAVF